MGLTPFGTCPERQLKKESPFYCCCLKLGCWNRKGGALGLLLLLQDSTSYHLPLFFFCPTFFTLFSPHRSLSVKTKGLFNVIAWNVIIDVFFLFGLVEVSFRTNKILQFCSNVFDGSSWLVYSASSGNLSNEICKFLFGVLVLATIGKSPWADAHNFDCKYSKSGTERPHSVSITEFGAVGDGVTLNTKAFQNAIFYLNSFSDKGGAQLFVPSGKWLTGSFSLISHLTLSLDKDAIIIGSLDPYDWPIIDPLPSYGRGRELPGARHQSLIYGYNLTDIVITGGNGTIDGQGNIWWDWFRNNTLNYTRPHLVEVMYSTGLVISNLTFKNSPFWTIHPVYCNQVFIQNITILAPLESPNTDGIDPDSSTNVCIKDCYISTGDDLIVIKSGWDKYGISFAQPSSNISIQSIFGETKSGAGIAIGSEMSGGVSEVHIEEIHIFNSLHGIHIKTSPGRGGYVRNIYISNVVLTNVDYAIRINGQYGQHPDDGYDPYALPDINNITIKDVYGLNIGTAGILEGIEGDIFCRICLSNISLNVASKDTSWTCSYIEGYSYLVSPNSCQLLQQIPNDSSVCYSPGLDSGDCSISSYVTLASL